MTAGWKDINSRSANAQGLESQSGDSSVFFIGSKGVGKSSLINLLQDKNEVPKSTLAFDYTFIRRSGKSMLKDVCHVLELGGGTSFSNLIDTPIRTIGNLKKMAVILMVDVSEPNQLWFTVEHLITKTYQVLSQYAREKKIMDDLTAKAWERMGDMEHHQDISAIMPFPVPLVIVGGKYDVFQKLDSEDRDMISQTLRSIAHGHGAMLLYYSLKDQVLCKRAKDTLIQLAFSLSYLNKHVCLDHLKPLSIPPGADSFQLIGSLPMSCSLSVAMQRWKHSFTSQFPQESESTIIPDDPGKDKNFEEPAIDALKSQKNEEFDKYHWEME
ncbi:cytoplasmic dynein 2 light intermediate chain 1 isoform X2 [Ischnura elegans]|uniref:cytoplasmic dynein 2 light intermediate chain 1 isoform X2 n=1 Tax=Ischnura elegans TaxID=197161 RepID=UPI001ED8663D|nr:cytoplasmic dynein 2 light intermediate chain 1 isoform X2 [Ischnura elegans]